MLNDFSSEKKEANLKMLVLRRPNFGESTILNKNWRVIITVVLLNIKEKKKDEA